MHCTRCSLPMGQASSVYANIVITQLWCSVKCRFVVTSRSITEIERPTGPERERESENTALM